jgi:DNA-binding response OmpR family regulator
VFVRRPNFKSLKMARAVRREDHGAMISESVWDMNYEPSSNVIDVYISSLRRKIDRGSRNPHIETVIGSGYRFVDCSQGQDAPARAVSET